MTPEKIYLYVPQGSKRGWIHRTVRAILIEKRMPSALQKRIDHALESIGLRQKTIMVGDYFVTFRRCTADTAFVHHVLLNQEYFREDYRPNPHDTIIDIGAHIGTFVLAAALHATNGRIIAIEPCPENLLLLRRNVNQNQLENVEVVSAAVGPSSGRGRLYLADVTGFHSTKFDRRRGSVDVVMLTLGDIFDRYQVDTCNFLKIHCEGAEFDFLPHVEPSVWRRMQRIAMEFVAPVPDWVYVNPTDAQVKSKLEFGDMLIDLIQRNGLRIDAYIDCVGFRTGYIFASSTKQSFA
jgi:FkbM family methyltransferase